MKRLLITLAGAAALLCLASCSISDVIGINFDYDIMNPWNSWEKLEPGIYLGTEDGYNKGDIIAKGTDLSMITCNVDGNYEVTPPDFKAYDGQNTLYTFGYDERKGNKYLHKTLTVVSDQASTSSISTLSSNVDAVRKLWGANCSALVMSPKKYKKIANGGDFLANYEKICQEYQNGLPYQAPDQQLTIEYTKFDTEWLYNLYPQDMNARGWVVPYTGKGKIEWCTVDRQRGWEEKGTRKVLWGGCSWENVTWVKAEISGLEFGDALEYVNKVKASGKFNQVIEDTASEELGVISFNATSDDSSESTEGFGGYIHPSYEISYSSLLYKTLTITFGVVYVTYV